ncbi:unnamed protein product [Rotaria sp. Silwood2]|nr:unnamed protein product [Rotaria sp. Silwood2]
MCSTGDVQFAVGEQSNEIRKKFWVTGCDICPMCKSKNIAARYWSCGCRFNGDAWGTIVYQCLDNETVKDIEKLQWDKKTRKLPGEHGCGFYTSFNYDEAVSGDEKYETHG